MAARFEPFTDVRGKWRWRLMDGNNRIVATSGEAFDSKANAVRAMRNVKATAPGAQVNDGHSDALDRALRAFLARRAA